MRCQTFLLLLLGSILFSITAARAQTTNGEILLTVKDQLDSAVVGAQTSLKDSSGKEKQNKTDSSGTVRFSRLGPGEYRITVSADGFKEYTIPDLKLKAAETRKIDVILELSPIESKVDVGANDNVDPTNSSAATVLDEKEIAQLPDDPAELEKAIKRIGEAVTGEDLPITVNGVQGGKLPPKAAIQQIRVNQNVFSAQYENPWGGGIEIFTKSDVEKFGGSATFSFADSHLNAADPFLGKRAPYQSRSYFLYLTGPLFGKKANFLAYGGHNEADSSSVINAVILDSQLQPVEFKQSLPTPTRSETLYFTVNADPTKKHKLYFSYSLQNSRSKGQNTGGFSLPSRANDNKYISNDFQFSDTYLVNANIVNQTRFSANFSSNDSFGGSNEPAINVLDAFFGGGSQQNSTDKNFRFDSSNDTTWQMGRYALGFGFRLRGERTDQNSLVDFGGTYTFSGRVAPVLDADNNPVIGDDGNIVTAQISSLESYRRTLLFQQLDFTNQRIRELGGGANQFTISGGDPSIGITQYDLGFYVQNSYKLTDAIALSFGLRYENQTNLSSNFNLAPRFGIVWAPKAKEKQNPIFALPRISIGYGLFFSRYALNNTLSIRQASDPDRDQYLITDPNILDLYPTVPTVDQLQQFAVPRTQRLIDENFQTPYQSLLNISASKKMPKGFTLNFTLSFGRSLRQSSTPNINAPLAGTFDPSDPTTAVRPFGDVGNIYESLSRGLTTTNRYSVFLSFPRSEKIFASLRYSFTKSKSDVVSGSGSPFDPYDLSQEFSPSSYDGVHSVGGYIYYSLPFDISGGGDFSIRSGTRFNITTGRDTNGDGFFSERPSFATDMNKPGLIATKYGILDPFPDPGDQLIPRNLGRGPANIIFNSSISKTFGFNEDKKDKKPPKQRLTFNLRVNNVFNIINKGNPIGNMSSPNFLRSLTGSSGDGSIIIINGSRQVSFPGRSMSFSISFGF